MCHFRHTLFSFALSLAALAALAAVMLTYEWEYLFRIQEQSLFLDTPDFFFDAVTRPAGLLSWTGACLTQFLYHPWLGTLILTACWALLMGLFCLTFKIPARWSVVALIPVCTIAITIFHLGYWIFYLKMQGYFFASTLGMAVAVGLLWTFRLLPHRMMIAPLFIVIAAFGGYPLFGCYALAATVLAGLMAWCLNGLSATQRATDTVLALLSAVAAPLCWYHLFHRTNIDDIWTAGIPAFESAEASYTPYYMPYALLALWLVLGCAFYQRTWKPLHTKVEIAFKMTLLLCACALTYINWYKDANFHRELHMYRAMEQQDWETILSDYRKAEAPTRLMWTMKNLALFRLGRQGDEMYHYRFGNRRPAAPFEAHILQTGGKLLYLNYGQANFCHRWCVEDGVEFGWRVEYLKCMATSMLMNGEQQAAEKYLGILRHTRYYQAWAPPTPQQLNLMRRLMPETDQLTNDNMLAEAFLLNHFATRDSDDPLVQEAALMFALQTCNKEVFLQRLDRYRKLQPGKTLPLHCQEALCVYNMTDSIPVGPDISQHYEQFMQTASQCRGMSLEQVKPLMRERFGDTFFFDYYFNNYQQPEGR